MNWPGYKQGHATLPLFKCTPRCDSARARAFCPLNYSVPTNIGRDGTVVLSKRLGESCAGGRRGGRRQLDAIIAHRFREKHPMFG